MSNYYYLVASLPHLEFKDKPPIEKKVFISECVKWLSPKDINIILAADAARERPEWPENEALAGWKAFDAELRMMLQEERKSRKTGGNYKASQELQVALEEATPLLMEMKYEEIRWNFLKEEMKQHFFDINWLIIYFLKLQILSRLGSFNKDKGEKFFYNLCEVNHEKAIG